MSQRRLRGTGKRKRDVAWRATAVRANKKTADTPSRDYPAVKCPECGKKAYKTRRAAERDARRIFPGATMRVYLCGQWWHLTTADARTAEALRDRDRAEPE
jgi:hypothetical protein